MKKCNKEEVLKDYSLYQMKKRELANLKKQWQDYKGYDMKKYPATFQDIADKHGITKQYVHSLMYELMKRKKLNK
jgi:hypothetical protein